MVDRLKDKVAIVTGGSKSCIGKGISRTFTTEGTKIVVEARIKSDIDSKSR